MILGNKCDMGDKRIVNQDRGDAVRSIAVHHNPSSMLYSNSRIAPIDCPRARHPLHGDVGQGEHQHRASILRTGRGDSRQDVGTRGGWERRTSGGGSAWPGKVTGIQGMLYVMRHNAPRTENLQHGVWIRRIGSREKEIVHIQFVCPNQLYTYIYNHSSIKNILKHNSYTNTFTLMV